MNATPKSALSDTLTVMEIIQRTVEYFRQKEIDSPRLTIELMLCHVLGCNRLDLYMHHDKPMKTNELDNLRSLIRRRAKREPLQYVLGATEFYGLPFKVNADVLIPRPETEILVDAVKRHIESCRMNQPIILDIGCGSGCISIALGKQFPEAKITAIDISDAALKVAKENSVLNNTNNISFIKKDVFSEWALSDNYDIIVSNPPYIAQNEMAELQPEVGQFEPKTALTDYKDGLAFYHRFAEIFPKILKHNSYYFVEIGYNQQNSVRSILSSAGMSANVYKDYANIPRIVAGAMMKI